MLGAILPSENKNIHIIWIGYVLRLTLYLNVFKIASYYYYDKMSFTEPRFTEMLVVGWWVV